MIVVINKYFNIYIISILFVIIQILVDANGFGNDSAPKLIQLESFRLNNWQSNEIFYPAQEFDPNFDFVPSPYGFIFPKNNKLVSVFPEFISYFYYPFTFIEYDKLHYLNGIFLFFTLFFFKKITNVSNYSVFVLFFCSIISCLYFSFSEYPLYFLFVGIGFGYFYKFLLNQDRIYFTFYSLFLGLALFLRLEPIIIYSVILFSISIVLKYFKNYNYKDTINCLYPGFIVYFSIFSSISFYNFLKHNHIFGNRFSANFHDLIDIQNQIVTALKISLFYIDNNKNIEIGYFLYSLPFLFFSFWLYGNRAKLTDLNKLFSSIILVLTLVTLGISPNSGYYLTGRYLAVITFLYILILDTNILEILKNKAWKVIWNISVLCSITFFIFFCISLYFGSKISREKDMFLNNSEATVYIFLSEEGIIQSINNLYFSKINLLFKEKNKYSKFHDVLNKINANKISIFYSGMDMPDYKESNERRYQLQSIISSLNYDCANEKTFTQYNFSLANRIDCSK